MITMSLKVLDQITFLTTRLTSTFFEILVPYLAHIFLIHILNFGVPKLGIYGEIIKNVSNKYQSVVTTLNKTINNKSIIFSYYFKAIYKSVDF